jgi:AraC-like DNA-binding protein
VGLNGPYLIRTFRKAVGVPPHSYLIHKRVERAKQLLRSGEPVAQVALMVGFSDQSHLNMHFKRLLNVTPGRYARSQFLPRKTL